MELYDYTGRDEQSLIDLADSYFEELLPEWKTRDDNDFNWALAKVIARLMSILNFYTDLAFNEQFPTTVQINRNALLQAKSKNMKVRTKVGGKVEITCEIEPPATDYTMVRGESFSSFRGDFILTEDVEILAGATSVIVTAQFGEHSTGILGTSDGSALQSYVIPEGNIQDGQIRIYVDGDLWEECLDTLMMEDSTSEVVKYWYNENQTYTVDFGDGVFGKIPPNGSEITYSVITIGEDLGNVPANSITSCSDSIVTGIVSSTQGIGGNNGDDLETIKNKLKQWDSIQNRVVLASDAKFLTSNYPGIEFVKVKTNNTVYNIYVIPFGGGTMSPTMIADLTEYLTKRAVQTLDINVYNFDEYQVVIDISLKVNPFYSTSLVESRVKNRIMETINDIKYIDDSVTLLKIYKKLGDIEGAEDILITHLYEASEGIALDNIFLADNQKAVITESNISILSEGGL
jgi:hypothetical protein